MPLTFLLHYTTTVEIRGKISQPLIFLRFTTRNKRENITTAYIPPLHC